ncbi:P-loop NTPase fold protein [Zooshikella ganghwensis]|uniref:P-loop NTPase fold protein n=1 Tax=Zooshikella ganghwensis TaxID=202772 RepID=UPI000402274F|nr:P-loop NTPase fold protein [Zooshikella ganghwensis]
MQYGMQKLVMINSGTYAFGEIPLHESVSFFGSNNRGKSTAINALQFFFLPSMVGSRFEKYSKEATRKFYFPHEASFILSEITTVHGSYVLGIAGKGPASGYRYQHFIYPGQLDTSVFFSEQRALTFSDIKKRLSQSGLKVTTLDPQEVESLISGGQSKCGFSLDLVPVGGSRRYQVFKSLFVSLITQSEINASMIKQSILDVFSHKLSSTDMNHTSLNFQQKKEEVFAEYYRLKKEYDALKASSEQIEALSAKCFQRDKATAVVFGLEGAINSEYTRWKSMVDEDINRLELQLADAQKQSNHFKCQEDQARKTHDNLLRQEAILEENIRRHQREAEQFNNLELYNPEQLNAEIDNLKARQIKLNNQLGVASLGGTEASLRRQMQAQEKIVRKLEQTLAANETFYNYITSKLPPEKALHLVKLISDDLLRLPINDDDSAIQITSDEAIQALLTDLTHDINEQGVLKAFGLEIDFNQLTAPHQQLTIDKQALETELQEALIKLEELDQRLSALLDESDIRSELKETNRQLQQKERELEAFNRYQASLPEFDTWQSSLSEIKAAIKNTAEEINTFRLQQENLAANHRETIEAHSKLLAERKQVEELYGQLQPPAISWPNNGQIDVDYSSMPLLDKIKTYQRHWRQAQETTTQMELIYRDIRDKGYRAAEQCSDLMASCHYILEAWEALPETETMLSQYKKSAILQLSSVLNDFLSDYLRLEREITQFNKSIAQRTVSNLKQFRILLQPVEEVFNAIKYIVETGHLIEEGQNHLLNFDPVAIDEERAMNSAEIIATRIHTSLSLGDLFTVAFEVEDQQGEIKRYDKIDDAGSTGTRSTLKLLTLMYLIRHMMSESLQAQQQRLLFTIDEIASVDAANARELLDSARALGFTPLLTSVYVVDLAHYGIDVVKAHSGVKRQQALVVKPESWIQLIPKTHENDLAIS